MSHLSPAAPEPGIPDRGRLRAEIIIVLALSLGASAVYSVVAIVNRMTRDVALSEQTATLNRSLDQREVFDLIYQLLAIATDLAPVALVGFLLWSVRRPHLARLGIDGERPWRDTRDGFGLALIIGAGGLGLYLAGRALGVTVGVDPAGLESYWWTIPVLLMRAALAGITEEVIVIGYLFARLKDLRWGPWAIILTCALLRATYHLYQGVGAFVGNFLMGVIFGRLYLRTGRVLPFVIAHTIINAVIFVGYPWAAAVFPTLLGVGA
ncbi:CPBP family intramembrane glutamic endopeptidase [Microcella flavibacter]|uniref:CPBP family intramembrane glutamic endopeptidase n=1 Tax=Microcella flavibacter TaxID=1804990 RepID=UPI00145694FA|nr:CPBP family intramembrane glutamic endopeptidase [Microcella flavibacter]